MTLVKAFGRSSVISGPNGMKMKGSLNSSFKLAESYLNDALNCSMMAPSKALISSGKMSLSLKTLLHSWYHNL